MAEGMKIHVEGKVYDMDDFELGELEWLEDEVGSLADENLRTMKAAVRFVTIIKRRDNPEFSIDEARKLKLTVFDEPETEEKRPTRAARGKSTRAASGASS